MGLGSTDFRYFWPSTAASIPSGSTRDTDFDDHYLAGAALQADADMTTQGGTTHDHGGDSAGHTHEMINTHYHTIEPEYAADLGIASGFPLEVTCSPKDHDHDLSASASNSGYTSSSATIAIPADTQHPKHTTVIVLQPDSADEDIPVGAVVLAANNTPATENSDLKVCDGANGTIDLRTYSFLRGAEAAGDGGGQAGADTHNHGGDGSHVHAGTAHGSCHNAECGNPTGIGSKAENILPTGTNDVAKHVLHHYLEFDSASPELETTAVTIDAANNQPAYAKAVAIQNKGASAAAPEPGMILPWVGTFADIPTDWVVCDGSRGTPKLTDRQMFCTDDYNEVGDLGGADSHLHTFDSAGTHTHNEASHTHTVVDAAPDADFVHFNGGGTATKAKRGHAHGTWQIGASGPIVSEAGSDSVSSTDGRYQFVRVIWLMYAPVGLSLSGAVEVSGNVGFNN